MNKSFLFGKGWKSFLVRYMIILGIIIALTRFFDLSEVLKPTSPPSIQSIGGPVMEIDHQLQGHDLYLQFSLENFTLSLEQAGRENQQNVGHIHLYLNEEKVAKIFEEEFVWRDLDPGTYHVRVELAHNDHEPYGMEENFIIEVDEA